MIAALRMFMYAPNTLVEVVLWDTPLPTYSHIPNIDILNILGIES